METEETTSMYEEEEVASVSAIRQEMDNRFDQFAASISQNNSMLKNEIQSMMTNNLESWFQRAVTHASQPSKHESRDYNNGHYEVPVADRVNSSWLIENEIPALLELGYDIEQTASRFNLSTVVVVVVGKY